MASRRAGRGADSLALLVLEVVEFLEHLLVKLVNASENALSVEVVLLLASDDRRVNAFDDLVDEKVKLFVVENVLTHVSDRVTDLGDRATDIRDRVVDLASVSDDCVNVFVEQVVVGSDGINILAELANVQRSVIGSEAGAVNLVTQDVHHVHTGVMAAAQCIVQLLVRLVDEESVLVLIRQGALRSSAVEISLLAEEVRRSHDDSLTASLELAITIDAHGGAVVVRVVAVSRLAELNAQATSLLVTVTEGAARRAAARVVAGGATERRGDSARVLKWHAVVAIDIVVGGLDGGRATGRTSLGLLSTSSSEVMGHDWGLATVAVEDVVFRTVDIVVVLDSLDVTNARDASIGKSAVDLLVVVGGRVGGHNGCRSGLLSGSIVVSDQDLKHD